LGLQALITRYGVLDFCVAQQVEPLLSRQFSDRYAPLPYPRGVSYYLDNDKEGSERLGRIYVDLGGSTQRIRQELKRKLRVMRESQAWSKLLDDDGFLFAIVVPTMAKRHSLAEAQVRAPLTGRYRFYVCPELVYLLGG
jgi:hypothetical protein